MKRILVIEDEANVRTNIQEILMLENFYTITAEDGLLGVQLAKEHRPDLVICDVMMPGLDGYGVLAQLRQDLATANIPLIFLTARVGRDDIRQGMDMGADDYLTKPFTAEELLRAIASRLERQTYAEVASQQKLNTLRNNIAHALPHELRTPLNGILSTTELLIDNHASLDDDELLELLELIHRSGHRLYRLIQQFLLYAELELIASQPERLQALRNAQNATSSEQVIEAVALKQAEQVRRELDLKLELCPFVLNISESHLKKVMTEIIDNAFKFSVPGTVVRVISHPDETDFKIYVTDAGRGMSVEQIASLGAYMQFERRLYEQQGSGLGLAIAQRLTEINGGQLTVESIAGQQTIVRISLPIEHGLDRALS